MCGKTQVLDVLFITIADHLGQLGKVTVYDRDSTERDLPRRDEMAIELTSYSRKKNWIKSIFTADEKRCLYVNNKCNPP
ncbi:hypothetical protein Y032_0566g20 [Ancylostoma ceylanicum]|uniref:Uncharacterized protein n=1 Tax=Ancylostoma ceylanicum TaxID=53326 RepID=A0A016WPD8_9BILA|nr:hypothetical protein Y032_0566g20 [Ancylostoma ceylanicum]